MKKVRLYKCKRERMIYFIIFLWVMFGVYAIHKDSDLAALSMYFASLTGFIGMYIWGETKRPSQETNVGPCAD